MKTTQKTDNKEKSEYKQINLLANPILTFSTLFVILSEQVGKFFNFLVSHKSLILIIIGYLGFSLLEGKHSEYVAYTNKILYFCAYWILLGVASSIGLGTGLHTFVLYLGPHIAKVTLAANECTYFPEMYPNRWEFSDFLPCNSPVNGNNQAVSFWTILLNVQLEAFMWGLGTAIGELPPYFMAKAAAESGKTTEEIEELREIEEKNSKGLMDKMKSFLYAHLKRHGFITVLLAASIPNPLFDLAGITCGHFSIPFSTFFGATLIGKAIIKVHIQAIFVILAFSEHHVEVLLTILEKRFPFLKSSLSQSLEKQKQMLWHTPGSKEINEKSKPIIATVWEVFITGMIIYFLISIINSVVNERRKKEFEDEKKDKKKLE